ncbi:hypothetical protein CV_3382 [Chromobacterium violaceum ATCC 12472]|uniref:Uncharacterized protein n=1 Tax=Chromobacterium violaceum (strain ATCC 12472 / DSM 30191 / JCM 1249 / CCUG 213 / NBRC 12614 / NCIMB 9131 / NCTC 9757 / MK) TaxID=243365 RepID=Q7NSN8_CHRVO|nr:hypothetical protein CV_3382 [Chromobacterium violaceum ATCC 12472]
MSLIYSASAGILTHPRPSASMQTRMRSLPSGQALAWARSETPAPDAFQRQGDDPRALSFTRAGGRRRPST